MGIDAFSFKRHNVRWRPSLLPMVG
jgi:hypothetical protein